MTDFAKTFQYVYNGKECFHDSYINKLTNYHNTTAKGWLVYFWALFLRPVRYPQALGCPFNVPGQLVQAASHLTDITTWLIHDVGHGFSYVYFGTFWVQWGLILSHFTLKLLSFPVTHNLVATHHPHPPPLYNCL